MTDPAPRLLDRHWRALEASPVSGDRRLRVTSLPVDTPRGRLAAAVDHVGHRHLLVPIASNQAVRRGMHGPALFLRRRPLEDEERYQVYADLSCARADLNDLFSLLCADVLETTEKSPDNPLKVLHRVLDRWKSLFQTTGLPLGPDQVAGLFGELFVLQRLLRLDSSAHRLWLGPTGHPHDFSGHDAAVEVKASTSALGRQARIHGLEQLQAPPRGELHLVWLRLRRTSETEGDGFVELVNRTLELCDDESALATLMAGAGLHLADTDLYRELRFAVDEERWYAVDDTFPRLTSADVAAEHTGRLHDVTYTVDLSTEPPFPLSDNRVRTHLARMTAQ